VLGKLWIEE